MLACSALAAAVAAGCRVQQPPSQHEREQILYQSSISDPRTFNPILVTDAASGEVIGDLFEGLVKINPITTLPEPDLAESWDLSDGGKVIVFHLRHGVKWFDGQPFTARDVLFTMRVIYDPRVPNIEEPSLTVDGRPLKVEALDDYTVRMTMPRVFAPLLYAIGVPIVPAHLLEPALEGGKFNHTWGINTAPEKIIGLGQFEMARYVQAQFVHFNRNPDYWMRDEKGQRLPRLHGETLQIVPDGNAQYLRFLAGQIDVYVPRPEEVVDLREKQKRLGITLKKIGIDTGSLFFAFNRNPNHYIHKGVINPKYRWFTDIRFLRAIAHAVDKQGMINLCFHGLAVSAVSDTSPANKVFHNPNLRDYDYNLKEAGDLLEKAGYHLVNGVRFDPQGNRLEFNLATNTGVNVRDEMCVIFQQDLLRLGIKVNYRPLEFTTLVDKLDSTYDWDVVLIGFTGGIEPNNGADFLRSSGALHLWYPKEPKPATPWEAEIDQLLEQGTMVMDPLKRAPYYWRIQKILHDELPIIETVRQVRYEAWKNSLENFQPTVWGTYKPEWIEFRPN
ncbi:MAG: ABC transporter substrate-binding protein [Candidatus Binataceae bacterium]